MQSRTSDLSTEPEELYQAAVYGFNAVKTIRSGKCVKVPEAISCNPEFAAYAIHQVPTNEICRFLKNNYINYRCSITVSLIINNLAV